jgi:Uma2 family endonuclease
MATVETLLTAEEFGQMPDDGRRTELVRGRIVELPPPKGRHGEICQRVSMLIGNHVEAHDLGTVLINDAGIISRRNPDSVRGADLAFYSFERMPRGPVPDTYSEVAPELVVEVRSPSDRWRDIHAKVAEYLNAGVLIVCVIDPETQTVRLYYPDHPEKILGPVDDLTFPACLPGFLVPIQCLFV